MIALYSHEKNLQIRLLSAINGSARFGLRQVHYIGLAETHLQNIFTAAAINIVRFSNWVSEVPLAKTRISAFEALRPMAA
jgi:hypothetical protein